MLTGLTVKNYALIDHLEVGFYKGLSTITGETGAGKSILLGALSLVLGKRADVSVVGNKDKKCVVEADFSIEKYQLESFFEENDLDYEKETTLRREILPGGKSRAFVNDTPATLNVLNLLSSKLIDVHSQHQTLQLADKNFQFGIIDALAENKNILKEYSEQLLQYKNLLKELQKIEEERKSADEELEYNRFIFNELDRAKLKEGETEELEESLERLSHFDEIRQHLSHAAEISEAEEIGLRSMLYSFKNDLQRISGFSDQYGQLSERIQSLYLEFTDISDEVSGEVEKISFDPEELEKVSNRLGLLFDLKKKYKAKDISGLIRLKEEVSEKLDLIENASELIDEKKKEIQKAEKKLDQLAKKIHQNRKASVKSFTDQLYKLLGELKMKNTVLKISLDPVKEYLPNGKDDLEFLISADRGKRFESIKKAASGGEMSRIMLAVKAILSSYTALPSIIFDEIDTGVSGEVSNKIAEVMQKMSTNMQVITITHLPQIAAKGEHHYKVYKEIDASEVRSKIRLLTPEERIVEIAEMLGGLPLTDSALAHAKQLLN
jgi:DNA repair protein RecN (Recombination protein N)